MVARSGKSGGKKGRVNVSKLQLNKETVRDLSAGDKKQIKGGNRNSGDYSRCCPVTSRDYGCTTQIYKGGPCGVLSQLDCI